MAHSNQIREFLITGNGVHLRDAYLGPEGVLTGSARLAQEARERDAEAARRQEIQRRQVQLERKRAALDAQIAALRTEVDAEELELKHLVGQEEARQAAAAGDRGKMAASRRAMAAAAPQGRPRQRTGK
jgi:circadian clock protein KaiC